MQNIKNLILVASGKGGVGKSTVATNLALALADKGFKTGLLDADIYGPSLPTMLGDAARPTSPDGKRIDPIEKFGIKLMSMGYMVEPDVAMVWRGPMLAGAVLQFVTDVEWGELDYLIFDLPPGTGDIQLSIAQKLKVTGALLVTTPQQVALADVYRAKAMFDQVKIETLGMVENMSHFICPGCDEKHAIFAEGGGRAAADKLQIPLFGEVPLETLVRVAGDGGEPVVRAHPESQSAQVFASIAEKLSQAVEVINASNQEAEKRRGGLNIIQ